MKKRIITALIMLAVLVPAVIVPALRNVFEVLVMVFIVAASLELLNMYDKKKRIPIYVKIITVIFTLLLFFSIMNTFEITRTTLIGRLLNYLNFQINLYMTIAIIFIGIVTCSLVLKNFDIEEAGACLLAIFYIGICFGSLMVLRAYGVRFIVYLFIVSAITDTFALVFGMTFGKHKMAPTISPKKTWEGAIGGTLVAMILGFVFLFFYTYISPIFHGDNKSVEFFNGVFDFESFSQHGKVLFMLVLTLLMSICSQLGDLVASKLKRNYGIKDYSNLFPGHGGVLDRFDSALFASAIFLVLLQIETIVFPIANTGVALGMFIG